MKKALVALLILLSLTASVFANGSSEEPAAAKEGTGNVATDPKVTLVYAEVNPLDTIVGRTGTYFKEQVEKLTGGSVIIDIQASGVLGSENDVLDSILGGGTQIDMSRISAFALTGYGAKKSMLLSIPFTFKNREHFWAFANSSLAPEFLNEPQEIKLPIRGVFYGEEGFRHFFTKTEVKSIADLKGLKLRVSNDPVMTGMVKGLGAAPTVVSFGELYSALQTGVVDGAEQPIANYKSNAFPEVAPNLILDGHTLGAIQVVICDNAWNKLTKAQQDAIMEAGKLAQAYNQKISQDAEDKVLAELRSSGCNVVDVTDKTPWQNACKDVIANSIKGQESLYQQIQALAK
ncbi:MAG: TRAP transporter substrate-binding protein [Spirochaetales bacterium]|nr:TRAP transporter substrate-binding protein [Spirochaetales bacterium]